MVNTIGPAGREATRTGITAEAAYAVGCASGGTVEMAAASLLGGEPATFPHANAGLTVLALGGSCLYLLENLTRVRTFCPFNRQVSPRTFGRHSKPVTAILWGFELGLGAVTRVNSWAYWSMAGFVLLAGDPGLGAVAGATYGVTRGLQPSTLGLLARRSEDWVTSAASLQRGIENAAVVLTFPCIASIILTTLGGL
jgi:hypothetical protein